MMAPILGCIVSTHGVNNIYAYLPFMSKQDRLRMPMFEGILMWLWMWIVMWILKQFWNCLRQGNSEGILMWILGEIWEGILGRILGGILREFWKPFKIITIRYWTEAGLPWEFWWHFDGIFGEFWRNFEGILRVVVSPKPWLAGKRLQISIL